LISSGNITGETRLVGVIGDPVRHSRSPAMLNAAFAKAGLDFRMLAMPVTKGHVEHAVAGLRSLGIIGCSVTMPHKAAVVDHLDQCSEVAKALNAVNCIRRDGDTLIGENTDGAGFLLGLAHDVGFDPAGRRCAVVGAGGAARAVVLALAGAGASQVVVVNRTQSSAEVAAALAPDVASVADEAALADVELIVQATSVGMSDGDGSAVDPALFRSGQIVADLVYHPTVTPTMSAASASGCVVTNGLSMLIHQGAVAFEHWTGRTAPIEAMTRAATGPP